MNSSAQLLPQTLELTMLVCLALPWPLNALRMLRSRRPEGRALPATLILLAGYLAGLLAKWLAAPVGVALPPVFWLCLLNAATISANVALTWHFSRRLARIGPAAPTRPPVV